MVAPARRSGSGWRLLAATAVIVAAVTVLGLLVYRPRAEQRAQKEVIESLALRADLRVMGIARWAQDGMDDARLLATGRPVQDLLQPSDPTPAARALATDEIAAILKVKPYRQGLVVRDEQVIVRGSSEPLTPDCSRFPNGAEPRGIGLHVHPGDTVWVQFAGRPAGPASGSAFVVLEVPAAEYLYPNATRLPVPLPSAEAILLRIDGQTVRYLSPLTFAPAPPLSVARPASSPEVASFLSADGGTGTDYRGHRVVAAARAIPSTPWTLLFKVDEDDALAAARRNIRTTILAWSAAALALAFGTLSVASWQRRRTADALAAAEQRLRLVLDHARDPIVVTTDDGVIVHANRRAHEFYGFDPGKLIGRNAIDDLLIEEDIPTARERMAAAMAAGDLLVESYHRRGDGVRVPVELSVRRLRLDGQALVVTVVRDSSERLAHEAAMRGQQHLLERITSLAPVTVYLFDLLSGKMLYASRHIETALGYTADEVLAMGSQVLEQLMHPDDRDDAARIPERYKTAADSAVLEQTYRMRSRSGEWRWLFSREVVFARDAEGRPRQVLGVAEDVTVWREVEAALRRSEAHFRTVFEQSPIGIVVRTLDGRITQVNPALERMLGYTERELTQMTFRDVTPIEDLEREEPLFRSLLAGDRASYTLDKRYRRKDGTLVETEVAITRILDEHGEAAFALALVQDVTERRLLQAQLVEAQKMEGIGRLAGGVAHDFNNLLTTILGYAEVLADAVEDHPSARGYAIEIQKAGTRAAMLTAQLLAFARRQVVARRTIDLNALVTDSARRLQQLLGDDVRIETSLAPELWPIHADPGQLEQVLVNMAVNARDAMPGGGRILIQTDNAPNAEDAAIEHAGDFVRLRVSDTGSGMTPEVQAHAFEPFFTTKELGKGTGLGLATCHGIVTQNGGFIRLQSEVGHGTTFDLYFPRAVSAPAYAHS
jgi:two-component system, cell cycle sensor histidine kinase and response regulator CckA